VNHQDILYYLDFLFLFYDIRKESRPQVDALPARDAELMVSFAYLEKVSEDRGKVSLEVELEGFGVGLVGIEVELGLVGLKRNLFSLFEIVVVVAV